MMKLTVFVLTALASIATSLTVATTPYYCGDVAGTWHVTNTGQGGVGNSNWILSQSSTGVISGSITNFYCSNPGDYFTFQVDSTQSLKQANGNFLIVNQANSQAPFCNPGPTTINIPQGTAGCATGTGSDFGTDPFTLQACQVPNNGTGGENATTFVPPWNKGVAQFQTTLKPPTSSPNFFDFGGRTVTITSSNPTDNCVPNIAPYDNGSIYIADGSSNTENVKEGWLSPVTVNQARLNWHALLLGCSRSYTETMNIDCQNGTQPFESHPMVYTINGDTVELERNGIFAGPPQNELFGLTVDLLIIRDLYHRLAPIVGGFYFH